MIKNFVKIFELLGDRLEVCVSVYIISYEKGIQKNVYLLVLKYFSRLINTIRNAIKIWLDRVNKPSIVNMVK